MPRKSKNTDVSPVILVFSLIIGLLAMAGKYGLGGTASWAIIFVAIIGLLSYATIK